MGIAVKAAQLIALLLKRGFYIIRQQGGHAQLQHVIDRTLRVTIPRSSKELPLKTLKSILKQAHIPWNEFLKMIGR